MKQIGELIVTLVICGAIGGAVAVGIGAVWDWYRRPKIKRQP